MAAESRSHWGISFARAHRLPSVTDKTIFNPGSRRKRIHLRAANAAFGPDASSRGDYSCLGLAGDGSVQHSAEGRDCLERVRSAVRAADIAAVRNHVSRDRATLNG